MIISSTSIPSSGHYGGSRLPVLVPVSEVFRADDASEQPANHSRRRPPADMSIFERLQRGGGISFSAAQQMSLRAKHAIETYSLMKDIEDKEYVRAVMGIDEYA